MQAKLQRRRQELTQATPDPTVDDEALYYNVAGECPKGRVYGLGSLGRKERRYADPGASTSQMSKMVPRSEFDSVAEQLRQNNQIGGFLWILSTPKELLEGAGDGAGPVVVYSGLEVLENQLDSC
ncbi:hypothetical protein Scep_018800 [Stephania cephalantha]|uniref:Uncharacterized protein n=1 Tax=Stephania cephalantha TaxID=152367 RepID=A0AAP0NP71_9MAGN